MNAIACESLKPSSSASIRTLRSRSTTASYDAVCERKVKCRARALCVNGAVVRAMVAMEASMSGDLLRLRVSVALCTSRSSRTARSRVVLSAHDEGAGLAFEVDGVDFAVLQYWIVSSRRTLSKQETAGGRAEALRTVMRHRRLTRSSSSTSQSFTQAKTLAQNLDKLVLLESGSP